ncbi:MAG TPA: peroxide stress protein YaaA [Candidatus Ligilactobacillus avistercoris]|nr:peroxide stress protein YaaA [Candidatus Ligilactobacillus avistercoris]
MEQLGIIISPAKKMVRDTDDFQDVTRPLYLDDARIIRDYLRAMSYDELAVMWHASDRITKASYHALQTMNLEHNLTPAIMAFQGLAYQYMAPDLFTDHGLAYLQDHITILSGFYGALRPFDGVAPYRLELKAKIHVNGSRNLPDFWGAKLHDAAFRNGKVVLNVASAMFARAVRRYLQPDEQLIDCVFGKLIDGRVVQRGTLAKMARGEMVRYLAENNVAHPEDAQQFQTRGYRYRPEFSSPTRYVFIQDEEN